MKKYLVILLLLATGCTSSLTRNIETVISQYDIIVFDDGININEAKIIGQRALIRQGLVGIYDLSSPKMVTNVSDLPNYEKYWFVSFKEKRIANIEFVFMAIINKQTGKVKFAEDFQEEKRWILEAVLLGG